NADDMGPTASYLQDQRDAAVCLVLLSILPSIPHASTPAANRSTRFFCNRPMPDDCCRPEKWTSSVRGGDGIPPWRHRKKTNVLQQAEVSGKSAPAAFMAGAVRRNRRAGWNRETALLHQVGTARNADGVHVAATAQSEIRTPLGGLGLNPDR